ncbi:MULTISPECIES: bifunctional acetate--CoA ligase family protein/GNAT family N-acetyltransferase [unclassified Bradyrhizobium]|uniref:bifunctional acetate--CoA ligase family protein/GNAT family N-acetyltransferase n=1 Tax=unclassified Bradyrhizobium TaxID=2631580 RepID=UPI002479F611|nr:MULTISPECIES: bifunctional acetate--CoA ligase family protein/GNAT family N-acetyltransferase [unclassified Bradyrhizobium]WGR73718.1 bifunctional acetate--CoA ligase family protein/GNAT family N-acetyltransferase [Bradyrhizobium sp. ISRA426]WGR78556.1 bifunctional acetate--CoA ligase family protein/GNAT family N-acetyltransferase [Bradyrhizobium sp. ISRA430]WGR88957.1 bifunctional acetate--CoA ligase family protein/GNAT family N-acetyltransferase [Bradyrhizobium sp. ISRA432]
MSTYRLKNLLSPRSVALVGASPRRASVGRAVLENIGKGQFKGQFGLVNPRYAEIDGVAAVDSLAKLPFVPELVVITAPASNVPAIVGQAGRLGSAGALIVSAGLGHGPGSLQDGTITAARKHSMRLIGPNCLGIMMPGVSLNASFAAHMPGAGNLALISQSGAIAAGMVDWAAQRGVGFSGIVSIGDQIDVDIADLLDHFALDHKTRAILLYIEAIKDARKFMSAARAAARVKPVVVVKSGRMAQGAKAAATHTGALAGADAVYDAAFRRAGVLRVSDLRELFDCAETLGRVESPTGKRLAILTNGGGIGVLAVDRLVELGGIPAPMTAEMRRNLDAVLPPTWSGANPVDIVGDADAARYAAALEVLLADPDNDAVLVLNVQTAIASAADIAATVTEHVRTYRTQHRSWAKPVLAAWVGANQNIIETLSGAGIPNYPTEDDAVRGFMHLVRHHEVVEELSQIPPAMPDRFVPDVEAARQIVTGAIADGRKWLEPVEIRRLLEAYDIAMVPTYAAADVDEAVAYASEMFAKGATVVLKIMSRDIAHKSDVGGVVLNLTTLDAVRVAAADILARARKLRPDARISGVIVQAMVVKAKARELILGLADDPTFGTVVVFGRGGTAVEIINDRALALPPLDLKLANDLIERTRVSRLLRAYRDVPAVKQDAVAMVLVKLAQMAADIPEIREFDINPLLADEAGVTAVDARVVVGLPQRKFAGSGPANFAVRAYPSQWERHLSLKDGWRIFARPLRPEDEPAIHEFLRHVTPNDLRLRFFAPMKEFTHEFIARLTQLDYARAMAFIAFDEATHEMVGVVRIHSDSIYETGEYAILLRSDLKGRGLGWGLMQLIIEYAKSEGLKTISGDVLQENTVMLEMCRQLGFEVKPDPTEPDVCDVRLKL